MVALVGLNRGSLMSARNRCLSLISPSHSVFTNRLDTSASSAAESRFTCASFHRRSRTMILLSRGSACCAASPTELTASKRVTMEVRIMRERVLRYLYYGRTYFDDSSDLRLQTTKIPLDGLRTSWRCSDHEWLI